MVNITDLLIVCTQVAGETGYIILVTLLSQIVTEDGMLLLLTHKPFFKGFALAGNKDWARTEFLRMTLLFYIYTQDFIAKSHMC